MKIYIVNGVKRAYADGKAPAGAVCISKIAKAEKPAADEKPAEAPVETKKRRTRNKARKPEEDK